MTVAIACAFQDGVLFSADTKITTGQEKSYQSKIYTRQHGIDVKNGVTVFTVAGDTDYAARAIQKCHRELNSLNFQNTSLDEMQDAIETVLAEYYQAHIFPHPDRQIIGFDLLIGLWLNAETRILATRDTAVRVVGGYECVGAGGYLARYWLRQALGPEGQYDPSKVTAEEASFVIEYAMNSTVAYDESCDYERPFPNIGGEGEYLAMKSNGEVGDIREHGFLGVFPDALQTESWRLLKSMAKSKNIGDETALNNFCDTVRSQYETVAKYQKDFEELRAARNAVFGDSQESGEP